MANSSYKQEQVSKVLINRYMRVTKNEVLRVEPKNLQDIRMLVYPRHVELFDGYLNKYMLGHVFDDYYLDDHQNFRKGDYIIRYATGEVKVVDAKAMECICKKTNRLSKSTLFA